ncbi:MAG: YbaN family protein [Gemmataceae bacterium]
MSEQREPVGPEPVRGFRRGVYILAGLFFVGLAILGAMLPLLPTTPFLLLASYFFVRSSPRLHCWLLRSHVFGPFLRDWNEHRAVRPGVKVVALSMLPTVVVASAVFGKLPWYLVLVLLGLASIGAFVVLRLPVIRTPRETSPVSNQRFDQPAAV